MKQADHTELGDSPAAIRLYTECREKPHLKKRVYGSLQKWSEMLHSVKQGKHAATLWKLIRKAFADAVERDMILPRWMKIGMCSVFATRYKKMIHAND